MVWRLPANGDIAQALTQHPEMYTLSMGHMGDLTLNAFAYLKLPLALAVIAFAAIGAGLALWRNDISKSVMAVAIGMVIFFQAARLALVRFDGYLGSYPLAESLISRRRDNWWKRTPTTLFPRSFFIPDGLRCC